MMTENITEDKQYWVAFSLIPGIGRVKISLLEKYFPSMKDAWFASAADLKASGLDDKTVETIISQKTAINPGLETEKLAKHKVDVLVYSEKSYPPRLKEIYDYPPVLYVRGTILPEDEWAISVVGTRRASVYGKQVAEEISADLARNKITITSGLAKGIDTIAHRAALNAGGRTIAVCGCGLDIIYPADNLNLAREIMEHGALISEFPLGTRPRADNFPRRNRIMSGISLGVLVIEAGDSSGALITVHHALEQNREIFAVPGSIFSPLSRGTNRLIQEGAKLVSGYTDIIEELNLTMVPEQLEMKELLPASDVESQILGCLSREAIHIDDICRLSKLPTSTVMGNISMMELKGIIKQIGNMNYALAREAKADYSSQDY